MKGRERVEDAHMEKRCIKAVLFSTPYMVCPKLPLTKKVCCTYCDGPIGIAERVHSETDIIMQRALSNTHIDFQQSKTQAQQTNGC